MASFGFLWLHKISFKTKLFYFCSNVLFLFFFLPPSICTLAGNYSLRGGRVNPAGHGKSLLRTAAGWQKSCAKTKAKHWVTARTTRHATHEKSQWETDGEEEETAVECNTTWEDESVVPLRALLMPSLHAVTSNVARSERPGAEQQTRRNYCIWMEARHWAVNEEMGYLFYWCGLLRRLVRWDWS